MLISFADPSADGFVKISGPIFLFFLWVLLPLCLWILFVDYFGLVFVHFFLSTNLHEFTRILIDQNGHHVGDVIEWFNPSIQKAKMGIREN